MSLCQTLSKSSLHPNCTWFSPGQTETGAAILLELISALTDVAEYCITGLAAPNVSSSGSGPNAVDVRQLLQIFESATIVFWRLVQGSISGGLDVSDADKLDKAKKWFGCLKALEELEQKVRPPLDRAVVHTTCEIVSELLYAVYN